MTLKPILYLFAAIFLAVGVYTFIKYVPISYVKASQVAEQANAEIEAAPKKTIKKQSRLLCEIEVFWAKYNVLGDMDNVYATAENKAADKRQGETVSCDETLEDGDQG